LGISHPNAGKSTASTNTTSSSWNCTCDAGSPCGSSTAKIPHGCGAKEAVPHLRTLRAAGEMEQGEMETVWNVAASTYLLFLTTLLHGFSATDLKLLKFLTNVR